MTTRQSLDDVAPHPLQKGHHTKGTTQYLFVDSCCQIWPDTAYEELHEYTPTAYCITTFRPHDGAENALDEIANWHRIERTYANVRIVRDAEDIVEAKRSGEVGIVIAAQGGDFIGQNIHRLEMFHAIGLRMMIPAYNARSTLCDGCLEPHDGGLSRLGKAWVAEANRLGVLIDLTHVGRRSTLEILDLTEKPVVFSHSNPLKLVDNPRNITDEQIKRAAETGGLVAVTNWGPLNFRAGSTKRPTVEDFIDAIDHVVGLVGIDHVGIGTDMSHGTYPDGDLVRGRSSKSTVGGPYAQHVEGSPRSRLRYVEGFDDYGQLPQVVEALSSRGYDEASVRKVLGENWVRVFKEVW